MITVSFSELSTFRQCPFKHKLAYEQRWQKQHKDSSALGLGTMWHLLKEIHYTCLKGTPTPASKLASAQRSVNRQLDEWEAESRDAEVLTTLEWMYRGYVDRYGADEGWEILGVETTHILPLNEEIQLKIKLDLTVRDQRGRMWVVDHKSAASMDSSEDLQWNDQFGLYVATMRKQSHKVAGAIYNGALKKPNKGDILKPGDEGYKTTMRETPMDKRFKRELLDRTDAECDSILADALADAQLAYSSANPQRRHANPDTCKWRCDYTEPCMTGRRMNDDSKTIEMLEFTGFEQNFTRH